MSPSCKILRTKSNNNRDYSSSIHLTRILKPRVWIPQQVNNSKCKWWMVSVI
jgi:hypothetical protein